MSTAPRPEAFTKVREALDLEQVVRDEGLKVRLASHGRTLYFECPACQQSLKAGRPAALSRDRIGWTCIRCDARGDAVDLIAFNRKVSPSAALKIASELAGAERPAERPARPAVPLVDVSPLAVEAREQRLRAIRIAADYYQGLATGDAETGDAESRLTFYAESLGGLRLAEGRFPADRIESVLAGAASARAYLRTRIGLADGEDIPTVVRELVGVCPAPVSGLAAALLDTGGRVLLEAAISAGLLRRDRAGQLIEVLGGRLVYFWTDARGSVVYLSGRAINGLAAAGAPKAIGLAVFDPERRGDRIGVPAPRWPFGIHHAAALAGERPVLVVEGELDALAFLEQGRAAVATGGTGRMQPAALREALGGRPAVVVFDNDPEPEKRARTDARAEALARALGCGWLPGAEVLNG